MNDFDFRNTIIDLIASLVPNDYIVERAYDIDSYYAIYIVGRKSGINLIAISIFQNIKIVCSLAATYLVGEMFSDSLENPDSIDNLEKWFKGPNGLNKLGDLN